MLQPKYTMHGFEWQDQRGVEGTGFVRALRSRLTSHLPQFRPDLDRIVRRTLEDEELSKPEEDGWHKYLLHTAWHWLTAIKASSTQNCSP